MKLTKENFDLLTISSGARSSLCNDLWLARSAIGVINNGIQQPVFGFGFAKDQTISELKSRYELLEHLAFLPALYSEVEARSEVKYISHPNSPPYVNPKVKDFLIGKPNDLGIFNANGCAISFSPEGAVKHANKELLERHICCEIWYERTRNIEQIDVDIGLNLNSKDVKLNFFTSALKNNGTFILATLESNQPMFYGFGAAVKDSLDEACFHAASEAIMLYEDALKGRNGISSTEESKAKVLSLRNAVLNKERKDYLISLLQSSADGGSELNYQIIQFEPMPSLFAARSFADNAFDLRNFKDYKNVPTMPLF
jgi:hypothetical protein